MSKITKLLATVGVGALMIVTVLTVGDALLRTYFANPIMGVSEVAGLLSLVAVTAFVPLSLEKRHHLSIDFVATLLGARVHRLLGVVSAAATLLFLAIIVWRLSVYSLDQLHSGASTWFLAWPIAPWWIVATVFLAACLPVQLLVIRDMLREKDGASDTHAAAFRPEGDSL